MLRACSRGLLLVAAVGISMLTAANSTVRAEFHHEAVDEQRYPYSSIGKLYNETGASCSGVVISRDAILTAAHCLYNYRTRRFIAAPALHFLVGYRTGRYSAHVRIASYEIGPGFDPLRYGLTSGSDWAMLKVTEPLPVAIEPLRLRRGSAPTGTRAMLVGYPQDRAFAMTADRECALGENIDAGRLLSHTCRGMKGYSGAPILVNADGKVQVAGIQIASLESNGTQKMIAVPAQAILRQDGGDVDTPAAVAVADAPGVPASETCVADTNAGELPSLEAILARLEPDRAVVQAGVASPISEPPGTAISALAWYPFEPFAIAF
jgi:protease YdgD